MRRRDGTFNYSADLYCEKYDETSGLCLNGDDCPLLHRTAGDTERRYHLRYYKTGMCVHDTDNRGFCVKNGPHCAFAHGANDLRPPVYDIKELQAIENGEIEDNRMGPNSLDKERNLLNDDPKWLDTTYVLANYKTEPCKKPPRLCRQGYACPQFHNNKDRRRSPKKYKYRSTPCPQVKSADEWGDPVSCESGDSCQYCHTRTEQQFHPEIYKSTKCNDIQNTSYCPRGAFCAFAHIEGQEGGLEGGNGSPNFAEILNHALPYDSSSDSNSDRSSNSGETLDFESRMRGDLDRSRAPGAQLNDLKSVPPISANHTSNMDSISNGYVSQPNCPGSPTYHKIRSYSGDSSQAILRNRLLQIENDISLSPHEKMVRCTAMYAEMQETVSQAINTHSLTSIGNTLTSSIANSLFSHNNNHGDSIGLDDLSLNELGDGSKSRKSSGFSETTKSRNCSGMDGDKSRNCSGNSISQGLVSSGFLSSSATHPVNIPGSVDYMPDRNEGFNLLSNMTSDITGQCDGGSYMSALGPPTNMGFNGGLFDFGPSSQSANSVKDAEIGRLREELTAARTKLSSWEESMTQARTACEAWKKEAREANRKAEQITKERDMALAKASSLQKEVERLSGGPLLHAIHRVADLPSLPTTVLKTLDWQLRKDIQEIEKAMRGQSDQQLWMSNNRLLEGVGVLPASQANSNINDWTLGLISSHPLYNQLSQQ